jgi:L-histidine Nalpha-methyltransferase
MEALAESTIRVDSYVGGHDTLHEMIEDVRDGLTRPFKELSPKYFYDARGSELFERITEQPEYYPTRCERAILNRRGPEIIERTGAEELVELGSGSASKTRALLYAMAGAGKLRRYVPIDVSQSVVERCAGELTELYPGLELHGLIGDFMRDLGRIPEGDRRLFAFLGGTIGNLYPHERERFLSRIGELLGPDDWLLLGTDLVKDPGVLEAAYNDDAGVTAEFNRNALRVMNRELGADFDVDAFEHVAFFDPESSWIEMRLRARGEQQVRVEHAALDLTFADGEEMRTEISSKFTPAGLAGELAGAGMRLVEFFTDGGEMFGLSLAAAR